MTDAEIQRIINNINLNFQRVNVANIVIMDTVLGVTDRTIPVNMTFQPGFTTYVGDDINFDLGEQLIAIQRGDRVEILFNKHYATAQYINGDLVIQDPLWLAQALVPLKIRFEYKNIPTGSSYTDTEIDTDNDGESLVPMPGTDNGLFIYDYAQLLPEAFMDVINQSGYITHMLEMIGTNFAYVVAGGEWHNCTPDEYEWIINSSTKGFVHFQCMGNPDDGISGIRIKYNHIERKLYFEITFADSDVSEEITSISITNDSTALDFKDENGNTITLPHTLKLESSSWIYAYRNGEYLGKIGYYYNHVDHEYQICYVGRASSDSDRNTYTYV